MTELELPPQVFERLRCYVETITRRDDATRTSHWATYGARNWIFFLPGRNRVRFEGGAGFDGYYPLNFRPRGPVEWLRQQWTLWSTREACNLFYRAFRETSRDAALDLNGVSRELGEPLTPHKALAGYYLNLLRPHLPERPGFRYLEIGAGTGYLAALLHHARQCRTIVVDLPEILPYSFIYLHRAFPRAEFQLPNEARDDGVISEAASFVFLSPDETGLIPDRSIDFAVNTASFGEMLPRQIAIYFDLLRRALREDGLFFTCNRVEKWMSPAESGPKTDTAGESVAVRFEDYPWLSGDRDIFCGPSEFHRVIQPENPFMQRLCRLARK